MKKWLALLTALAMVVSLAIPAPGEGFGEDHDRIRPIGKNQDNPGV